MPRTRNMSPQLFKAGINEVIKLYGARRTPWWTKMAKVVDTSDITYNFATVSDFPAATEVNEATGIPYEDIATPFTASVRPVKRGIGFAISDEALRSAKYGLINERAPRMARAIAKSQEADLAGFMNLATTGAITTPDGVNLISNAHLTSTGFMSNQLTSNPALSIASLETAIGDLMLQVDYTGDPMMLEGPYDLFVHPANAMLAQRLAGANQVPQSNNNDPNPAGRMIRNVYANPYFTNSTAWMLVSAGEGENPFLFVRQSGVRTHEDYDIDKDVHKFTATASWAKAVRHPQGIVYSSGAGS